MALLNIENMSLSFDGLMALHEVSIEVTQGEIFSLIGPNGSGKTTLLNCINGLYKPQKGNIYFEKTYITGFSPSKITPLGIARTFQNLELLPEMNVKENIMVGLHPRIRMRDFLRGIFKKNFIDCWEWSENEAFKIMDFLGITAFHNRTVSGLPFGIQKLVEIGRALATEPKVLLLDEPSSGMNEQEAYEISKIVTDLRDNLGITILLVEHNMKLVLDISDRVCVLNSGQILAQGVPSDVLKDPAVIDAYIGRED